MHPLPPTFSESSTQTDSQERDLQNLSSLTLKSFSVQTDPCDLPKVKIAEDSISQQSEEECDADPTLEFDQDQELQKRMNPTTPEDFEINQTELMQSRHRQERKIKMTARNPDHKQSKMSTLLNKEAHHLRKIASLKHLACEKWRTERLEDIMEKMSQPKQWGGADGSLCLAVDTPETVRAREMKDMYEELRKTIDNVRSRIEMLHKAKALIYKHCDHSSLVKDVCSLIDRELEILGSTELGNDLIAGLRTRTLNAFAKLATKMHSPRGSKPKFKLTFDK